MDSVASLIERAINQGPFTMQQVAAEAGISYDSLYSWSKQRRVPKPDNLRQLARAFDRRAIMLREVAEALQSAAESLET